MLKIRMPFLFTLIILLVLLTACVPKSTREGEKWAYSDIVYFEDIDSSNPYSEIIAIYSKAQDHPQIRIDFLELDTETDLEIMILVDYKSGGNNDLEDINSSLNIWDKLIRISSLSSSNTVMIDHSMDTITLDLPIDEQCSLKTLQVFSRIKGSQIWEDETEIISLNTISEIPQAPILLTFWNELQAETPAQLLRQWDGAHSGPFGRRHGLKHLLVAIDEYQVPVILATMKSQQSIDNLTYLGQTQWLRDLNKRGYLILPDSFANLGFLQTPKVKNPNLENLSNHSSNFLLTNSFTDLPSQYSALFMSGIDTTHIFNYQGRKVIPLPENYFLDLVYSNNKNNTISQHGLALEIKKELVSVALSADKTDLVNLGGNFRNSPWGDPDISQEAMSYIAYHPWINPLDRYEILNFPTSKESFLQQVCYDPLCTPEEIFLQKYEHRDEFALIENELKNLPKNSYTTSAINTYQFLRFEQVDPNLNQLKQDQFTILQPIIAASKWLEHPRKIQSCQENYCYLASQDVFLGIDQNNGSLTIFGSNFNQNPVLWLGSSAFLAIGLSDFDDWAILNGKLSDPEIIPGAFFNEIFSNSSFHTEFDQQELILENLQNQNKITYTLETDGYTVQMISAQKEWVLIPIFHNEIISSTSHTLPVINSFYLENETVHQFTIQDQSLQIIYSNEMPIELNSYLDSIEWMTSPENPNRENPPGHYLPISMSLLKIKTGGYFEASVRIIDH